MTPEEILAQFNVQNSINNKLTDTIEKVFRIVQSQGQTIELQNKTINLLIERVDELERRFQV